MAAWDHHQPRTTLFQHLGRTIAYVKSTSGALQAGKWELEKVLATMQVSFPELTDLRLRSDGETMPVIPSSFLGESAPRLRHFEFDGIPFRDCQTRFVRDSPCLTSPKEYTSFGIHFTRNDRRSYLRAVQP